MEFFLFGGSGLTGLGLGLIGTIFSISSSSRLSADGSLSEPELSPSLPDVILIRFALFDNSCSRSLAFSLEYRVSSEF